MTSQQKMILAAGAVGALVILQKKKQPGKVGSTGLLSKLMPTRGTNSGYVASTNMATRNGTASAPRVPSSGLGYGTTARGVAQAPTTAGAIALGSAGVLKSLFDFLARKPAAPAKAPAGGGSASRGGGGGSPSGGGGGGGSRRVSSPMGGSAGVAAGGNSDSSTPIQGGAFDENGNWIPDDSSETSIVGGTFDENGDWQPDDSSSTPITGGVFDENGAWVPDDSSETPVVSGAFDENGNWQPEEDPGAEFLNSDPLDSTPIGNGDFSTMPNVDPIGMDSPDMSSGTDDQSFGAVDDSVGNFGGGDDTADNWWIEDDF